MAILTSLAGNRLSVGRQLPQPLGEGVHRAQSSRPQGPPQQPREQKARAEDKALWGSGAQSMPVHCRGGGQLPLPAVWVSGSQGLLWPPGTVGWSLGPCP